MLVISSFVSIVFFLLSLASLYEEGETGILSTGFVTPWFTWQVDAVAVYFLTAVLCLVTAKLVMDIFFDKTDENVEIVTL